MSTGLLSLFSGLAYFENLLCAEGLPLLSIVARVMLLARVALRAWMMRNSVAER